MSSSGHWKSSFAIVTEPQPTCDPITEMDSIAEIVVIPLLKFDEYEQHRRQLIEDLWLELKEEYIEKLFALLTQPTYDYHETVAKELAEDLLDPDIIFYLNPVESENGPVESENGNHNPEDSENDEKELIEYRKKWQQTLKEQLLMLRFPLDNKPHPRNEDDISRKQQNETFVRRYGGTPTVCHQCINNRDELFECIKSYLQQDCSTTCLATIVFNGHGSPNGLNVFTGCPIPLDDIVKLVDDSLNTINKSIKMPLAVDIVFAQCFGYLHSYKENPGDLINVITLTKKERRTTMSSTRISSQQNRHYHLESYAERRNRLGLQVQSDATTNLQGATGGHA